jgi:hypothetical protein
MVEVSRTENYEKRIAEELEKSFTSRIDALFRSQRDIKADTRLKNGSQIKSKFLEPKLKRQELAKSALVDPVETCNALISTDFGSEYPSASVLRN